MKKEKEIQNAPEVVEEPAAEEIKYSSEELQAIEDHRILFFNRYRTQNRYKSIIFCVGLVVLLLTFLLIPNLAGDAKWQLPLMIGITVLALGGILAYSFITRKKMTKAMREYFGIFYGNINNYVFAGKSYKNVDFQNPGKIEDHLFTDSALYANVFEVRSRGATNFEYEGKQMLVCDCAGTYKAEKRVMPLFVGKYVVTGNSYKGKDPIFIYHKGDQRSLPPTNLSEVKVVYDNKGLTIYSNDSKWSSVITSKFLKSLEALKPNKELVDIAISIQQGTTYFALGYDDPLMVVPLDQPFNEAPVKIYKKDMATVCKIAKELD